MSLLQAGWNGGCPGIWCVGVGLHSEAFWTHTHSSIQGCALAPPCHPLQDPREQQAQLNSTGWKPCPPPTFRIIPSKVAGPGAPRHGPGDLPPLPCSEKPVGRPVLQRVFQTKASSSGEHTERLNFSYPGCAGTF